MRSPGGDHLVETGSVPVRLVTRGQVSVRMDTRRNIGVVGRDLGKHEWSFGKRGSGMTQEVLGALPDLGSRAGRAVLRWNKASRLMRRKTSTDIVNLNRMWVGTLLHKPAKLPRSLKQLPPIRRALR